MRIYEVSGIDFDTTWGNVVTAVNGAFQDGLPLTLAGKHESLDTLFSLFVREVDIRPEYSPKDGSVKDRIDFAGDANGTYLGRERVGPIVVFILRVASF